MSSIINKKGCNTMRKNMASGLTYDNSQKMHLHQAAAPPLIHINPFSKKHFENPNVFLSNASELGTPCSPKQSSILGNHIAKKNLLNSSIVSSGNTQSINSDTMQFDKSSEGTVSNNKNTIKPESHREEPEMETSDEEMSCSDESEESPMEVCIDDDDDDEDSFIVFEAEPGPSNGRDSLIIEFSDEDDSDMEIGVGEAAESDSESSDDFVVFADQEPEEIPAVEEQKPNNGKKVTFAKESELCTVHKMVKWSFAYRKARKGLWEQFGRDTERFKYRAFQFGASLNQFLLPEHRRKVYEERFKNRQD